MPRILYLWNVKLPSINSIRFSFFLLLDISILYHFPEDFEQILFIRNTYTEHDRDFEDLWIELEWSLCTHSKREKKAQINSNYQETLTRRPRTHWRHSIGVALPRLLNRPRTHLHVHNLRSLLEVPRRHHRISSLPPLQRPQRHQLPLMLLLLLRFACTKKDKLNRIGRGIELGLRESIDWKSATYFRCSRRRERRCRGGQDRQYRNSKGQFRDLGSILEASNRETRERTVPGPTIDRKSPPPSDMPTERTKVRSDSTSTMTVVYVKLPP